MPRARPRPSGPDQQVPALVVVLLILLALWLTQPRPARRPVGPAPAPSAEGYLFCTWNVENFFDDRDDPLNRDEDEDFFGRNPGLVREKVAHLADALLRQNGGRGPDILAAVEVESLRAVELLRDALNARLPAEARYDNVVFRENRTGRRFAPAVLTRLPVRDDLTRTFGIRRILEAHLEARGAPLVVLASHWTSRLREGNEAKREAYADALYDEFLDLGRDDPEVDVLLSGDFNDEPDDPSLRDHLRTTDDPARVRAGGRRPWLLDLMAGRDPDRFGTYFYSGRWQILDHILASPGLLNPPGWVVLPETLRVENGPEVSYGRNQRPWRFGGPKEPNPRGVSDHFAVTVRLRVNSEGTN